MVLSGDQLEPAGRSRRRAVSKASTTTHQPRGDARGSIDLHGKTVEEALEALDSFLSDALLASLDEVRVIHGRSGGRIRDAVHERLREVSAVRSFRLDPRNAGVTIVSFFA